MNEIEALMFEKLEAEVEEEKCILEIYRASAERRIRELEWDYDAACASLETRDNEIEELDAKVAELKEHYSLQVAAIGGKDNYIRSLEAEVKGLEAWKEKMRDEFSIAVQVDLEHGVQWMNEEASADFSKKYPKLCEALSLLEQDDEE